ncbi:hypothetical protein FEE96_22905 [Parasedimentitalea maritima]|uniref:Flagellar FliJ protein n=1 Tax=Parasedimentitalea maritima TaxID=2578117 RepID=A0ABY2UNE2_9RHOB|nr:hypothetical protein [Zongyanglinia marina]TLP55326.1 hypothetical protein FEE96_22905 [Zongyanglinia marina]
MKRPEQMLQLQALNEMRVQHAKNKLYRASVKKRRVAQALDSFTQELQRKQSGIGEYARQRFMQMPDQDHRLSSFQSIAYGVFQRRQELTHIQHNIEHKALEQEHVEGEYQEQAKRYKSKLETQKTVDRFSVQILRQRDELVEMEAEDDIYPTLRGQA